MAYAAIGLRYVAPIVMKSAEQWVSEGQFILPRGVKVARLIKAIQEDAWRDGVNFGAGMDPDRDPDELCAQEYDKLFGVKKEP